MYINAYKKYQVKYSCFSKYLGVDGTLKEIKKEKIFNIGGSGLAKIIADNINDINFLESEINENNIVVIQFDKDSGETVYLQYEIKELEIKKESKKCVV
ncbi:MAG: hypothetical protein IJW26_01230 [Clostridia bacterium]|nr:hypothetical protein [Clostridia bacterium]